SARGPQGPESGSAGHLQGQERPAQGPQRPAARPPGPLVRLKVLVKKAACSKARRPFSFKVIYNRDLKISAGAPSRKSLPETQLSMVPSKTRTAAPLTRGTSLLPLFETSTSMWLGRPISAPCRICSVWPASSLPCLTRYAPNEPAAEPVAASS